MSFGVSNVLRFTQQMAEKNTTGFEVQQKEISKSTKVHQRSIFNLLYISIAEKMAELFLDLNLPPLENCKAGLSKSNSLE